MGSLNMDRIYEYMFHLISEYSKLQDFKPTPPTTALEVCVESVLCFADEKQRMFLNKSTAFPSHKPPCNLKPAQLYHLQFTPQIYQRILHIQEHEISVNIYTLLNIVKIQCLLGYHLQDLALVIGHHHLTASKSNTTGTFIFILFSVFPLFFFFILHKFLNHNKTKIKQSEPIYNVVT